MIARLAWNAFTLAIVVAGMWSALRIMVAVFSAAAPGALP